MKVSYESFKAKTESTSTISTLLCKKQRFSGGTQDNFMFHYFDSNEVVCLKADAKSWKKLFATHHLAEK